MRPWRPETGPRVKGIEYSFSLHRQYEPSDLAQCDLLESTPPDEAYNSEAISRAHDGEMIVPVRHIPGGFDIMCGVTYWYFVPERTRAILEASDLRHVLFRPTVHVPHVVERDELGNPIELIFNMDEFAL